jgi:hypothetical protein
MVAHNSSMAVLIKPGALSCEIVLKFLRASRAASACLLNARSEFVVVVLVTEAILDKFPKEKGQPGMRRF